MGKVRFVSSVCEESSPVPHLPYMMSEGEERITGRIFILYVFTLPSILGVLCLLFFVANLIDFLSVLYIEFASGVLLSFRYLFLFTKNIVSFYRKSLKISSNAGCKTTMSGVVVASFSASILIASSIIFYIVVDPNDHATSLSMIKVACSIAFFFVFATASFCQAYLFFLSLERGSLRRCGRIHEAHALRKRVHGRRSPASFRLVWNEPFVSEAERRFTRYMLASIFMALPALAFFFFLELRNVPVIPYKGIVRSVSQSWSFKTSYHCSIYIDTSVGEFGLIEAGTCSDLLKKGDNVEFSGRTMNVTGGRWIVRHSIKMDGRSVREAIYP